MGAGLTDDEDRRGPADRPLEALVDSIRGSVAAFDARTPREVESRRRILTELDRLTSPFDREADRVHVTGSGIVLGARGTVLHLHKRLGIWMQPGGHIESGEAPWDAALRETREETGLPVAHPEDGPSLVHLDAHAAGDHFHLDLRYVLVAPDVDPCPPPDESQQVAWFTLEAALASADQGLVDGLRRVSSYRWSP